MTSCVVVQNAFSAIGHVSRSRQHRMPLLLLILHAPCFPHLPRRRSRNCCKRRFGWLLEHTEPQTTCLFDDQGQPAVDFLGRVENLDEDMQARWIA